MHGFEELAITISPLSIHNIAKYFSFIEINLPSVFNLDKKHFSYFSLFSLKIKFHNSFNILIFISNFF